MPNVIDVLEATLESWAKDHARSTGLPFAKAYDDMLQNDAVAREFYVKIRTARRNPAVVAERGKELRKRVYRQRPELRVSDEEKKLDDLANEHARDRSISKAAAYDEILRTAEGRDLYAKHYAKRRAAI
jgi:hypothetical protein